jgi:dolichol-phosphate mannosyltransferase
MNTKDKNLASVEYGQIELSIVAPMFNEQNNIETTLQKLTSVLETAEKKYEIIFVNDGSTDETLSICENAKKEFPTLRIVSYVPNQGRGKALREGINHARGKYICTIDFDLSYDETHILRMYSEITQHVNIDAVLVSCYMPGGKTEGVSPFRLFISKTGNMILRTAFPQKIYTSTCVVRCYKREVIQSIPLDSDDKEIHLEILSKLFALGHKVKEIPGTLTKRKMGKSKFKFKATSISHLLFTLTERPALYLALIGVVFLFASLMFSAILIYFRIYPEVVSEYKIFGRLISSTFIVFLTVIGFQSFILSFLALLIGGLRKEIIRTQAMIKSTKE